jgi:hypothetical protein
VELDASTKIAAAFARFHGWTYDAERPQVPQRIPGVPAGVDVATALPGRTSCSPLTAWCVLAAFHELRVTPVVWKAINVWDGYGPWAPVDVLADFGFPGTSPFVRATPGVWTPGVYLTQSWRRVVDGVVDVSAGGHSRLVEVLPGDQGLLVREASRSAGVVRERIEAPDAWKRWGAETRAVRLG